MNIRHPQRRFLCFLIIFTFIFSFASIPVRAEDEGVVTGSVLNVRNGPGTTYKVLAKTQAGQQFTVLDKSGDWLKVRLHNGQEGWIHKDYAEVKTVLKKVTVKGSTVNIRKGPGTSYAKIGQVNNGTFLSVYQEKNDWYLVWVPGVGQAWIANWLTEEVKAEPEPAPVSAPSQVPNTQKPGYVVVTVDVLNVRSGPGTGYSKISKIGLNENHAVLEQKDGWYKIQIGNIQGWVSGEYVRAVDSPESNTTSTSQPDPVTDTVIVTGSVVNIRQNASLDAPVTTKVNSGDRLSVVGKQGDWLQVQLPDGAKGWVAQWLTETALGSSASRSVQESEVLIAPIATGKTFKVIDSIGRPILVLEGWASNEYQIKEGKQANSLILELQGSTERNYEGKITRLGISNVKIYPQDSKCIIELAFTFAPTKNINYDSASKVTKIQVGAVETKGLRGKVIVVDPGHSSVQPGGWLDPGAIGTRLGLKEKDVNLSIALKLKNLLEQSGARVLMTHTGQTELSLAGRAELANDNNADIFVSIHANYNNSKDISGHSTYYYAPSSDPILGAQKYSREKLAALVQRELVKAGGRKDLGTMQERFAVLRETRVPSILVETAFLSNPEEESMLNSDSYRQKLAQGIYNGIRAYFE